MPPTLLLVIHDSVIDLRQLRTFVAVAERSSFTRAADDLHIAQQAVSQQVKALERTLGVTLFRRSSRRVELTPEGKVFLADSRRILANVERAVRRARSAAAGELGTIRLAYTLTTAWDTIPRMLARLGELHPDLTVESREVFGTDIPDLLMSDRADLALAPMTMYSPGVRTEAIRRDPLCVAVQDTDPLAERERIALGELRERRFEFWPRDMAPGFHDAVMGACRAAGFEPDRDENAAGNTAWGFIADGRGVALINRSLERQLPRGIILLPFDPPVSLTIDAAWCHTDRATVARVLETARTLADEQRWLVAD